jgi:hypothetical protein
MSEWQIVERLTDPAQYDEIAGRFTDADDHPFMGAFGRRIYPTYFAAGSLVDVSYAVARRQVPVALVEALRDPAGAFTRAGHALRIQLAGADDAWRDSAIEVALDHLLAAARRSPQPTTPIEIEDHAVTDDMSAIGRWAMKRGGHPLLTPWPVIDLQRPEAELWHGVRKSYRSLIRWGERNLAIAYYNRETARIEDLQDALTFLVGQGVVLDPRTVSVYHDFIQRGAGEWAVVRHQGRTVGSLIVIDEGALGFYALGYYEHEAGDAPIAHWPLWNAILRCRARGRQRFDLYRVFFRGQERAGYRLGVALFKLGFTDSVRQRLIWCVPVERDGADGAPASC